LSGINFGISRDGSAHPVSDRVLASAFRDGSRMDQQAAVILYA